MSELTMHLRHSTRARAGPSVRSVYKILYSGADEPKPPRPSASNKAGSKCRTGEIVGMVRNPEFTQALSQEGSNIPHTTSLSYHKDVRPTVNEVLYDLEPEDIEFLNRLPGEERAYISDDAFEWLVHSFDAMFPFDGQAPDDLLPAMYAELREFHPQRHSRLFEAPGAGEGVPRCVERVFRCWQHKRACLGHRPVIPFFRPPPDENDEDYRRPFRVCAEVYSGSGSHSRLSPVARALFTKRCPPLERIDNCAAGLDEAIELTKRVVEREILYENKMYFALSINARKYGLPDVKEMLRLRPSIPLIEETYNDLKITDESWTKRDLLLDTQVEQRPQAYMYESGTGLSPMSPTPRARRAPRSHVTSPRHNASTARSPASTAQNTKPPRKKDPYKDFLLDIPQDRSEASQNVDNDFGIVQEIPSVRVREIMEQFLREKDRDVGGGKESPTDAKYWSECNASENSRNNNNNSNNNSSNTTQNTDETTANMMTENIGSTEKWIHERTSLLNMIHREEKKEGNQSIEKILEKTLFTFVGSDGRLYIYRFI